MTTPPRPSADALAFTFLSPKTRAAFEALVPELRRVAGLSVAEITRRIAKKAKSGALRDPQDFSELGAILRDAPMYRTELRGFLEISPMTFGELRDQVENTRRYRLTRELSKLAMLRLQSRVPLTAEEKTRYARVTKLMNHDLDAALRAREQKPGSARPSTA